MPTTQTVTYDPTDDSVLVEEAEARDAETLEVGEKMMAEQENLLAGKYKTTEDLEKAYKELESKLGKQDKGLERDDVPDPEETTEEKEPQLTKEDFYNEDGSVNYDTTEQAYGKQISDIFKSNEIDPMKMTEYFVENNGTLSDEMYNQLSEAGLPREAVNQYLQGARQQVGFTQEVELPVLNNEEVAEVKAIAGGEEGYEQLMSWASDNMSEADANNFDEIINLQNKAAAKFAVKALMGQYEDAVGRDSNLIQGKQSTPQEVYRSMAEVVRDMNNPLYDSDEAYRDDVRRKLETSNIKV
mgnify:CR=1 FL=1|tara:strand:- start:55 stop:951 length:897 start_codon:yes stop_codon:yes gene_type:complete